MARAAPELVLSLQRAFWAMLGAAEALSYAAATAEITAAQAQDELFETFVAMVTRRARPACAS
ncbi:hypothetical protein NKI56_32180 [Mesorhizobium sp. M0622]|uniref:hypothetical protein n=1 Tax=unclassified Mesorhizobium TaxID=325217 RepID=UPI0033395D2B